MNPEDHIEKIFNFDKIEIPSDCVTPEQVQSYKLNYKMMSFYYGQKGVDEFVAASPDKRANVVQHMLNVTQQQAKLAFEQLIVMNISVLKKQIENKDGATILDIINQFNRIHENLFALLARVSQVIADFKKNNAPEMFEDPVNHPLVKVIDHILSELTYLPQMHSMTEEERLPVKKHIDKQREIVSIMNLRHTRDNDLEGIKKEYVLENTIARRTWVRHTQEEIDKAMLPIALEIIKSFSQSGNSKEEILREINNEVLFHVTVFTDVPIEDIEKTAKELTERYYAEGQCYFALPQTSF